jgi:hypothetical protein
MTTSEDHSSDMSGTAKVDTKLEVMVIPVSLAGPTDAQMGSLPG